MNKHASAIVLLVFLASSTAFADSPSRVVSLDYCADQFVLKLLPREKILALSKDAERDFSYMRKSAKGIPQVRPVAENILALQPDLIVRSYGGGAQALGFFERVGVPVVQLPYANTVNDIRSNIVEVATSLGVPNQGKAVQAQMDKRLAAIRTAATGSSTLYMTPTGVTSGTGTLVHEMLLAAGRTNFEKRRGWHALPLERLAFERPTQVAAAFFTQTTNHPALWSAMRHPVAKRQISELPTVMLQGSWTACGGWFLIDAIEALAAP
ncbi:MAG: ABC transporter substrate-binding protein [Pseudomonadota bacterium]